MCLSTRKCLLRWLFSLSRSRIDDFTSAGLNMRLHALSEGRRMCMLHLLTMEEPR